MGGRCYIFGDRSHGQHVIPTSSAVTVLTGRDAFRGEDCRIVRVAADGDHTVLIKDSGKVLRTVAVGQVSTSQLPHDGESI
jgi:hypothetical protein